MKFLLAIGVLAWAPEAASAAASPLPSVPYSITHIGLNVAVGRANSLAQYQPDFTVISSTTDPKLQLSNFSSTPGETTAGVNQENYPLPNWRRANTSILTDNLYEAGAVTRVRAIGSRKLANGGVVWLFANSGDFSLSAEMQPVPGGPPRLSWTFTPRKSGWYTVGYTGGPTFDPKQADGFLQPLIWQEKRFPRSPLLTAESMGGLPLTLVSKGATTVGLSVDPSESPYRLPTIANARFGVMLRNPQGQAQPSVFAPLFGQAQSWIKAGQSVHFTVRPLIADGNWYTAFTEAAQTLFHFGDVRQNVDQPLNATIDSMVDFAMDDAHSGWDADLKGFDYNTDVKGTVKVVSALHPLAMSLIQDDPEIYRLRALPMTEFLMSRTKYLYNAIPSEAGQNAARDMKGPAAEVSELAELYQMSHQQSPVFKSYALSLAGKPRALNLLMISSGDNFWDKLALYRLTGDPKRLEEARLLADKYIAGRLDRPQTDFSDVHIETGGQFWSDFAPRWIELFELWKETRAPRYLNAAQAGAREYASYAWYYPAIPPANVTVDQNNAPVGYFRAQPGDAAIRTPPQTLPAWQVSQIGLTPEAQTTYHLNPGIFLAHHAPFELRIAAETGDKFLHDTARAAVVGRYKTYPGYDINVAYSNVYARADYPYRPFAELNYNEIYYNHVWPQIALLTDYLVSDFEVRSGGKIRFPARYAHGYAYLHSNVYGDRPGTFMGDSNVRLWMPRRLVSTDDVQANYLTGYGTGKLYVAFSNESDQARVVRFHFDRERVPYTLGQHYTARIWRDGRPAGSVDVVNGSATVPISAKGLTALAIENMPVFTRLQHDYFAQTGDAVGNKSFRTDQSREGTVTAMFLNFAGRRDFYLWTSASDADVREARLTIRSSKGDKTFTDTRHPFEFSVPANGLNQVDYDVQFVRSDGTIDRLGRKSISAGN